MLSRLLPDMLAVKLSICIERHVSNVDGLLPSSLPVLIMLQSNHASCNRSIPEQSF